MFVLLFHEFCHLLFLKLFKQKLQLIEITAFGGMIHCQIDAEFIEEVLIYSAGILGNLIIFLLFPNKDSIFTTIVEYNKLMLIINSLLIYPLDGFRVYNLILSQFISERKSEYISLITSIISLVFFLGYSIFIKSLPFILMAILLIYYNICFFYRLDDIILRKIMKKIKRGQ